ncbi:MAG: TonB-dependent receptor, partial [Candidatus Marinimicrobia bacterium]|nr:TonB-dependent receptor [Candidatus Neomarinimicrobiota bacterium]
MMRRKYLVLLFAFLSLFMTLQAATTGKVNGIVTDGGTGDPLIGVNVMIAGTSLGAATDLEGYFTILNVPPGKYELLASSIGYKTFRLQDLRVSVDHTTNISISMESSVLEGEEVVVVAQKELIKKGLTSSESSISEEELESMPVESFAGLLATQAGVTQGSDGSLHVRGGRASEVTYMVDGIPVSSDLGLSLSTNVISELTLISGTFNAEYGKAMSGIVNIATKDGARTFQSRLTAQFGDMLTWNDRYINGSGFNPLTFQRYDLDLSGPISFLPEGSYFITGTFRNHLGWLYGIREHTTFDQGAIGNNTASVMMTGDSALVKMNTSNSKKIMAKISFMPLEKTKLTYQLIGDFGAWQNYEHEWKYAPDGRYQYHSDDIMHALHLTRTISEKTYFTFKYSYKHGHSEQYVNKIEIPFSMDEDINGNGVIDILPGLNVSEDLNGNGILDTDVQVDWDFINEYGAFIPNGTWYDLDLGDTTVSVPYYVNKSLRTDIPAYHFNYGGQEMGYYISDDKTHTFKFDFISQVNRANQIRTGFEFNTYVRHRNETTLQMSDQLDGIPPFIQNAGVANHDYYTHKPYDFAAYLQDKIEIQDIIIQAGLRYDYFNANTITVDPLTSDTTNASPKHQLSPRLGVSFPITDQGFIHFSYGHFFQMPSMYYLYTNPLMKRGASVSRYGNPDIEPQKTVMYELGLQQELSSSTAIDLTI